MKRYVYSEEELSLIENNPVPFAVYQFVDKRAVTIALSQGFLDLFCLNDRQAAYRLMDNEMYRNAHPDDISRIADAAYRFAVNDEEYNVLFRLKVLGELRVIKARGKHVYKPDGTRLAMVWYEDEGPFVESPDGEGGIFAYSLSRAVNEYSKSYNSNYDHLTGLPQMSHFLELAMAGREAIIESGDSPAMLYIDLSGMKMFNQRFGYKEGDELLRKVADVLVRYFSSENCSRFTGDHFAVYTGHEGLDEKLKDLLYEIEHVNGGNSLPVRIGVYKASNFFVDASIACDRAKMACDSSKGSYVSGINYFDEKMLLREEMRQYVISNLDKAISEGWIKVFYQAIVRTANGRVCDEEALSRWSDPERGLIMPSDYIPVLEEAGIIYKLDLYVTQQVISKLKAQADSGLYVVPQSVNLSRTDFYTCDIVEEIRKRMDDAGLDHSKLTIEITEGVIGRDVEFMEAQIERFQELGFKIWMDDYGSGYSSPELLQKIHFDTIKFDMQYMRDFNKGPENRIILTELIKMAVALGIETVVEGVEMAEQVEFLKEVGCTKLQGYYFVKPISWEEIIERNRKGIQIGFENPDEAEYYSAIGRVNLYDLAITHDDNEEGFLDNYFNTLPMAILEMNDTEMWVARANPAYKSFITTNFAAEDALSERHRKIDDLIAAKVSILPRILRQCAEDGQRVIFDEQIANGQTLHVFIRRAAVNPVTKVVAFAVVVLGVDSDKNKNKLSYRLVAQALSSDYINLYYVDLDTEKFVEYGSGESYDDLAIERHGEDFFAQCHQEKIRLIYEDDRESFTQNFTKEKIVEALDKRGVFTFSARFYEKGKPVYIHMKAVRIRENSNSIIIGVSNIDSQKKKQEYFERIREEQLTFSRIAALSGNYLLIFTVDPFTGEYSTYASDKTMKRSGIPDTGDRFLEKFKKAVEIMVYSEDKENLLEELTMDKIKAQVEEKGIYTHIYRDLREEEPRYVELRVAFVEEKDGRKILFGVKDVDKEVRTEQEAAKKLTAARNEANLDALTGVKNKHAYVDVEAQINRMIDNNEAPDFAIAVLDINGLKVINDTKGHQAGDEHIKKGCAIICKIFRHSPVFRVGGDEFAVILRDGDYKYMDKLEELMAKSNEENRKEGGVDIAAGFARYHNEKNVADVFSKADANMYENKRLLKGM